MNIKEEGDKGEEEKKEEKVTLRSSLGTVLWVYKVGLN